ncbi:hypothetical protein CAMSH0001_0725 [Campylobacter showae RM3277]|uniref:Uncharacterized protein n=1 Tax=Campylobacter showae RM3277 TaxID=553219 RepID=C6RH97_9BACT|nr:hypothetical protein CAMSH0001_0725 [Campylobacter showae RM3277]
MTRDGRAGDSGKLNLPAGTSLASKFKRVVLSRQTLAR